MSATQVPQATITTPEAVQTGAGNQQGVAPNRDENFGGARLLYSDARAAFLLLD